MKRSTKHGSSVKKQRRKDKTLYDSDKLIRKIHKSLIGDLKPIKSDWFVSPRKYVGPDYSNWPTYEFKKMTQLELFAKRVILSDDPPFNFVKLVSMDQFLEAQKVLGIKRYTRRLDKIVQRASEIVAEILGPFSYERFFRLCVFGKRAAKDLKFKDSFLDIRIDKLNGSKEQIEWFKACMSEDIHLHRACRRGLKKAYLAGTIDLAGVPKSYKAARIVFPDTTIGGFLSKGLGWYLRERLEAGTHIDLETQQEFHRLLAKQASIDGKNATLDMKRASDSYVWEHIELLCPLDWLPAFSVVRTKVAKSGNNRYHELGSAMLAGSGHTFPAQTLFFYAFCKSVVELLGMKSEVHVYGDDLIVPTRAASYIIDAFDDFGFIVNTDKSFTEGPFRESCGGDYHHGFDVRPFMPEHVCSNKLDKYAYTAFIHKIANGLLEHWDYCEVSETYDLLLLEVAMLWGNLCPIPENAVEFGGLKYIPPKFDSLVRKPEFENGLKHYLVLSMKVRRREPEQQRIYYWYWLRGPSPMDLYGGGSDGHLDKHGKEATKEFHGYRWKSTRK